jgi:hypothetical protein
MARIESTSVDVTFDAYFKAPAFSLAQQNVATLKSLHEALSVRYQISAGEMKVSGGNTLSDVAVSVDLFGGSGQVEVTVDHVRLSFRRLMTAADRNVAVDCAVLTTGAVAEVLGVEYQWSSFNFNANYQFIDTGLNASEHLARLWRPEIIKRGDHVAAGAVERFGAVYEFENPIEHWDVVFHALRSRATAHEIAVISIARFLDENTVTGIEPKLQRLDMAFGAFCSRLGLELPDVGVE